ncbi:MAG: exodeoxyribonuclease III [Chitinophagales bacterium]|nr:exodeoxyribonuclease III [Chitinophagales bacterium]
MKLISFNVNGVRAIVKKDFFKSVSTMQADVLCLQETKAQDEQVLESLSELKNYRIYCNSAEKKGYSGVAILSKKEPLSISRDIQIDVHDTEGRVLCAEYEDFYLVNVYVPNSGSELKRLTYRQKWDKDFLAYLKNLEKTKAVIVCGDFNVANTDIDLANPKSNYNKSAGYMQEEIDGMNNLLKSGFIDSFRYFHPEKIKYSWWSYRAGARERNVGWRIDYFLVSEFFKEKMENAEIYNEIYGSDHCPVALSIKN